MANPTGINQYTKGGGFSTSSVKAGFTKKNAAMPRKITLTAMRTILHNANSPAKGLKRVGYSTTIKPSKGVRYK